VLRAGLRHDLVTDVRGSGLLIGLTLAEPVSKQVVLAAQRHGFILNDPTPERIRLAPPLVLTEAQAQTLIDAWPGILAEALTGEAVGV
jgi:acetylornithine aminotransferase